MTEPGKTSHAKAIGHLRKATAALAVAAGASQAGAAAHLVSAAQLATTIQAAQPIGAPIIPAPLPGPVQHTGPVIPAPLPGPVQHTGPVIPVPLQPLPAHLPGGGKAVPGQAEPA